MMRVFGFVYDLAFACAYLLYLPLFFAKGKHRGPAATRFGRVRPEHLEPLAGRRTVWIHAVSVGEVVQAARLRRCLEERRPDLGCLVTVTTATGYQVAREMLGARAPLVYCPIDLGVCVRSFLRAVRPRLVVIFETEIWPNLLSELERSGVPACVVNGRISDRAHARYRAVRPLLAPFLRTLEAVLVQDEEMAARFERLGAVRERIRVTGNMKYDWQPGEPDPSVLAIESVLGPRPVWIAGSTHETEEAAVLEAHRAASASCPGLALVLAPRHPERFQVAADAVARAGFKCRRASRLNPGERLADDEVLLLDRMGVLAVLYRAARVVFVGGSLVPVGGHNLVEPAHHAKPVLFGPHTANFRLMCDAFVEAGAGFLVRDARELARRLETLLSDPVLAGKAGDAARRLVERHRGATQKNIDRLLECVR